MQYIQSDYSMNSTSNQSIHDGTLTQVPITIPYGAIDPNGDPSYVYQQLGQVMVHGYAPTTQSGFLPMLCAPYYNGQWNNGQRIGNNYHDYVLYEQPNYPPAYYTIDVHGNYVLIQPSNKNGDSGCESTDSVFSNSKPSAGGDASSSIEKSVSSDYNSSLSNNGFDSSPQQQQFHLNSSKQSNSYFNLRRSNNQNTTNGRIRNNSTYKTMICTMFSSNGSCNYGNRCQYAHGKEELRVVTPHPKFKTQLCNKYNSATGCQYGDKCHFRHPNDPLPSQEFSSSMPFNGRDNSSLNRSNNLRFDRSSRTFKKSDKSISVYTSKNSVDEIPKIKNDDNKDGFLKGYDGNDLLDNLDEKNKECFIKLSMYHHFEMYVGKNRKVKTLKRSNSCNTVGSFTFQRFVAMKEVVKEEVNRLKPKSKKETTKKILNK